MRKILSNSLRRTRKLTHVVFASNVSHDGITLNNLLVSILQIGELQLEVNHNRSCSGRTIQYSYIQISPTYVGEVHSKCRFFVKPAALVIVWCWEGKKGGAYCKQAHFIAEWQMDKGSELKPSSKNSWKQQTLAHPTDCCLHCVLQPLGFSIISFIILPSPQR